MFQDTFELNWILPLTVAVLVLYFLNFINQLYSYPPGPLPLPLIGNLLLFRGSYNDEAPCEKFKKLSKKYGSIFTLWIGPRPIVIIDDYKLSYEALVEKKNDFIDKSETSLNLIFRSGNANIFSTGGPAWEALRKIGLVAARKFSENDYLPVLISDVIDEASQLMLKQQEAFDPIPFADLVVYNIIASIAFGKRYKMDDEEFLIVKRLNDDFYILVGNGLLSEFIPFLKPFYYHREYKMNQLMEGFKKILKFNLVEHQKSYVPGITRDFTDCVIEAKESVRENLDFNKYYRDENLMMVVSDLFLAGTDTSQTTMRWIFLYLANYPEIQQKLFHEINNRIGNRIPSQEDKKLLPYTFAFVLEILRLRPSAPFGLDHCAGVDSKIAGHKIKKGTRILFNLYAQNTDPKFWEDAEQFKPERFLNVEDGSLKTSRAQSFMTFGLGRRVCPGEKLALINIFLATVRIVQNLELHLSTGSHSHDCKLVNIMLGAFPKDYKITCIKRTS